MAPCVDDDSVTVDMIGDCWTGDIGGSNVSWPTLATPCFVACIYVAPASLRLVIQTLSQ